jgi:hypothetical protein
MEPNRTMYRHGSPIQREAHLSRGYEETLHRLHWETVQGFSMNEENYFLRANPTCPAPPRPEELLRNL